jgi:hypothetical protein
MRALAVVLLLSVPLTADDDSSLQEAVELFKSQDAGKRAAGSQLAERELRRLLAPLLAALKHYDPEVRRRARRAILSLVPGEPKKEQARQARKPVMVGVIGLAGGVGRAFRGRRGFRRFVRVRSEPLQPTQIQRANLTRTGERLLAGLGVHWKTQWRAPLMPGFRILKVLPGTPAARLGLRKGDLLIRIDRNEVSVLRGVRAIESTRATVTVYRGGRYVRLALNQAPRK